MDLDGTASYRLIECNDEDADIYSDIFEIYAEVVNHMVEGV